MQPHARGAGPAVEGECHRPGRWVLAIRGVGGDEYLCAGLGAVELIVRVGLFTQHDPAGGGCIAQLAVLERDRVPGCDQIVNRLAGLVLAILLVAVLALVLRRLRHGSTVSGLGWLALLAAWRQAGCGYVRPDCRLARSGDRGEPRPRPGLRGKAA